ncbi:glutathione S-transferase family protein [Cupriavidus oxalaticus]|uniref:glutathione S-transferase family protein n=1 Tax=Cupriavidus oxalaticus TaxID=96344 RepID=UPI003175BC11
MQLYAHPFSSYCQKVLIALYENAIPFEFRMLSPDHPEHAAEHARLWPLQRMPVLVDGPRTVFESSIIIEYLDQHHRGEVRWLPDAPDDALEVRLLDRFFDQYVMTPMQRIVLDYLRPPGQRDAYGVAEARKLLESAYAWLDARLAGREWASGAAFTLADCAAAPSLFYADWVHPVPASCPHVRAYRSRLLARPSFARAVDEARPYRSFFPPGAPDRD